MPQTIEEEEAGRPDGSYEHPAREAARNYEPMVMARYGEEQATNIFANAKALAEGDEGVYAECLLDRLPELARMECGRRSAGRH